MSKTTRATLIVVVILVALLWAAHHLDLFGLLKRLHGG